MIDGLRVAVIGLGLMGGSLARALAQRGVHVLGHDRNGVHLDAALRAGAVHEPLDAELGALEGVDVVVLAVPVDVTVALLERHATRFATARLVTDLASTKRSIQDTAERVGLGRCYVGAHPLTGSHRSGWSATRASMYDGARVFLCPGPRASAEAVALSHELWRSLRSGVEVLDAATHDAQMAWRSHLPHVVSTALAVTLGDAGVRRSALGPGGRDVTRLAGGATSMWGAIVQDNAPAIVEALAAYEARVRAFREALQSADAEATRAFLIAGTDWFDGDPEASPRASL